MPAHCKPNHLRDISNHTIHHSNSQLHSLHTIRQHNTNSHMHRNTKADTKEDEDVDAAVEEDTAEDADEPIIKDNKIPKSVKTIIKAEDNSKRQGTKHHQTTNSVKGFTTNQ